MYRKRSIEIGVGVPECSDVIGWNFLACLRGIAQAGPYWVEQGLLERMHQIKISVWGQQPMSSLSDQSQHTGPFGLVPHTFLNPAPESHQVLASGWKKTTGLRPNVFSRRNEDF